MKKEVNITLAYDEKEGDINIEIISDLNPIEEYGMMLVLRKFLKQEY